MDEQQPSHPGLHPPDLAEPPGVQTPVPASQVDPESYVASTRQGPEQYLVTALGGAGCWAGQNWPYGKPVAVTAFTGSIRNSWGDYTIQSSGGIPLLSREEVRKRNDERRALAMPLLPEPEE